MNNVVVTLLFYDDFTRNITFEGVASADLSDEEFEQMLIAFITDIYFGVTKIMKESVI